MEVTLSTGRKVEIASLKLGQLRRMAEAADSGKAFEATINACVDAMRNADATGAPVSAAWFEDEFTMVEANELFAAVTSASGIKLGEATASR